MVYHGPAGRALGYFAAHGYECEEHDNPADFFLDIIIQNEEIMQTSLSATAVWQNGTPGGTHSPTSTGPGTESISLLDLAYVYYNNTFVQLCMYLCIYRYMHVRTYVSIYAYT